VFSLRPAQTQDFDRLWQIDQICFPQGISYSKAELRGFIRLRQSITLVAEEEGTIAGFLVLLLDRRRRFGHIITIDVLPEFRRKGLGRELMAAAEDSIIEAGGDAVLLEVAVDNSSALRFYKKLGFRVLTTLPKYYSNGMDALQMGKVIAESQAAGEG
jgi:ribosomal-protein-alanine N-acetyltransferase